MNPIGTTVPLTMDSIIKSYPILNKPVASKILVGSVAVVDRLKTVIPVARTGETSLFAIPIIIDPVIGYDNLEVRDQFDQTMLRLRVLS